MLEDLKKFADPEQIIVMGKKKAAYLVTRSARGSKYRGVSRNGPKWQICVSKGNLRKYIGAIASQD